MKGEQEIAAEKVAIYIRWSTEDQGEGTTLDVQMEGCQHYVLSQGWQLRSDLIFIDDGYSGATLNRPALSRLRERVKQGDVECVVVYKLDRLSRSVADTARLCMDEWDGVCAIKSAREPIDTQTQAGRMFFYTLMNYAEWERSVIRDRTHSGRVRRAQEGRNPGITIPYGYGRDPETGRFVIIAHEAAVVRQIFDSYRLGAGLLTIVNGLNQSGIPFRHGRKWRVNTTAYILSNSAYTGELVWGRRLRNPRYHKREGEKLVLLRDEPLVRKAGVYPPIISQEAFEQVQLIRRERPRVGRGSGRSMASGYMLTGHLRCGLCGRPMIGQHNDPKRQHGYYYSCITRRDQGRAACPAPNIPCHLLDARITERLMALYRTEQIRHRCLAILTEHAARKREEMQSELADIDRRLSRLQQRERRLYQEYNDQVITVEEFRHLRAALHEESAPLMGARTLLQSSIRSLDLTLDEATDLHRRIEQLRAWEDLTIPQRKQLLGRLVERVTAWKREQEIACEITWRVPTLPCHPEDAYTPV